MRYRGASRERCFELFSRLGFRSLVMEFAPTAETVGKDYAIVESLDELRALADRAAGRRPLRPARAPRRAVRDARRDRRALVLDRAAARALRAAGRATARGGGLFAPATTSGPRRRRSRRGAGRAEAGPRGRRDPKIGHDLKFDAIVLARHGVTLRGLETDTMIASYLLDANRSSHPLEDLAHRAHRLQGAERGGRLRPRREGVSFARHRRRARARLRRRARRPGAAARADAARAAARSDELRAVYDELEQPLIPVLVDIERAGVGSTARRSPRRPARIDQELSRLAATRSTSSRARSSTSTRRRSCRRSSSTSSACGPRRSGGRRRRRRSRRRSKCSRSWRSTHELPRLILEWRSAAEAEGHLHRRAAAARQPGDRPRAHLLQPGGRGDRAAEQQRSEPAEHPDPDRDRPRDPARVRRRARPRADLGRLLADRAARARAPVGRRGADRRVPPRRRHPRPHGARRCSARRAA